MASTLSEAYRDHPQYLHHIIPIDFSSVRSLPDSHAWPQTMDGAGRCSADDDDEEGSGLSIPVIDLMDPNAVEQIGFACEEWGVFQLKNHGVGLSLLEEVEAEAKRLFALPANQKLKALRSPDGATGYGRARISPFFPKYMWHEGFTIMGSPFHDANEIWPDHCAPFCELMENYQKQLKVLAEKLTRMMLGFVGISEEEAKWVGSSGSTGAVQLNYYPQCPEPNRAMGLAPHTDTSVLTILHQSQTKGLQIFKDRVGWVPVHPDPRALVVNVGDLLHIISNARFPCVLHRVTVDRVQHRYSVAYFYGPPLDYVLLSPLAEQARFRGRHSERVYRD
ncbi:gibberellin 3-beta-dioxygenase 2-like [Prosopis cineraria]|uniref:gibberellin 3-beta-dioxygenase 2-like n=1 Tax=Prosopis cineraria TaxID=364024 RepID=UPI00240FF542|nr:gibberellin 3-beta-dioxygenase 2-like [Prosopis cineraria]